MKERLKTPEGKELYSLRQQTVEPVFGNIKWNMGFARFGLHGKQGAMSETWLMCIAHNLGILVRRLGSTRIAGLVARFLTIFDCRMARMAAYPA